jgi:hypothetical protein
MNEDPKTNWTTSTSTATTFTDLVHQKTMLAVGWVCLPPLTLLAVYICIIFYCCCSQYVHKMSNTITVYKALEYFNVCYSLMVVQ